MVLDAVANFVRGNTDAAVDNSQTTISVVDASIFPDPALQGEFNVVIWDAENSPRPDQDPNVEILRVTAIDTVADELTVTRGQEMTAAAVHPSGSAVHLSPTAKMFSDIESTFSDFWDASAEELTADVNNDSVSTDGASIGDTYLYASFYDGADADARLDNALSDATDGDTIFLESAEYSDNRSIATRVLLQGSSAPFRGTLLTGTWTLNDFIKVRDIDGSAGGSVTVAAQRCEFSFCVVLDIQVDADRVRVLGQEEGLVSFASGTSEGIVDSCRGTIVTDNGNNTVGDIS